MAKYVIVDPKHVNGEVEYVSVDAKDVKGNAKYVSDDPDMSTVSLNMSAERQRNSSDSADRFLSTYRNERQ